MDLVTLVVQDGTQVLVAPPVAGKMLTVAAALEDADDAIVPVPGVSAETLRKVVEFCARDPPPRGSCWRDTADDAQWRGAFFADLDPDSVFAVVNAANFLNCQELLDLGCRHIARQIRGMTTEQMRTHLRLEDDLTPQEKADIRAETEWCLDSMHP